ITPPCRTLSSCARQAESAVKPDVLLHSISRFLRFLPGEQRQAFVQLGNEKYKVNREYIPERLEAAQYDELRQRVLRPDGWRCQFCGARTNVEVHLQKNFGHS